MMGAFIRACDYVNALRERGRLIAEIGTVFERVDVLICPTMPGVAPKLGELGNMMSRSRPSFNRVFNLTARRPCRSAPASRRGLPLNMQIVGRPFQDDLVLRVGSAFEKRPPFATCARRSGPSRPSPPSDPEPFPRSWRP